MRYCISSSDVFVITGVLVFFLADHRGRERREDGEGAWRGRTERKKGDGHRRGRREREHKKQKHRVPCREVD